MGSLKNKIADFVILTGCITIFGGCVYLADYFIRKDGYEKRTIIALEKAEANKLVTATVLEEQYQNALSPVKEFNGLISYSNETVKLESKYVLKVKTDGGRILSINIKDHGAFTKESLDMLIDKDTKIQFPIGNFKKCYYDTEEETDFRVNQIGTKYADKIKVLEKP